MNKVIKKENVCCKYSNIRIEDLLLPSAQKNYFANCMNILGLKKEKFIFTNDEAKLLEMNGIKVNSILINDE